MRISDWSSDVCSSDLNPFVLSLSKHRTSLLRWGRKERPFDKLRANGKRVRRIIRSPWAHRKSRASPPAHSPAHRPAAHRRSAGDRTGVLSGKRVSVLVELGGRQLIQKKKHIIN